MSTRSSRSSVAANNDEGNASATSSKRERSHSSSSATASSSSSRQIQRRKSNDAHEAVPEVDEDLIRPRVFKAHKDDLNAMVLSSIEIKEKQHDKWRKLSDEAQAQCVKTVVRLLVMKGARKEPLTRNNISDCLGKVDPNYKKHLDVVLMESQKELEGVFGYSISSGDQVRGTTGGKKDDIYVFSILKSPRLLSSLSDLAEDEAAFTGFCFVIFQILFTSSGKSADAKTVLQKLRKVDSRFPETLLARPKSSTARRANPVPELKDDFLGLMAQMKR
jgi:MAGE family